MMKSVFLFHTSSAAMWANHKIKQAGITAKLASVPRDLSSDCGYCIISDTDNRDSIEILLEEEKIEFEKVINHEI